MGQAARRFEPIDDEVQEALTICRGDAMAALRITLIANAFLEAQIDELKEQVSAGYARRSGQALSRWAHEVRRAGAPRRCRLGHRAVAVRRADHGLSGILGGREADLAEAVKMANSE